MKRHQLLDHWHRNGCKLEREGARHSIYANPVTGGIAPVPPHSEIDNRLAAKICRELKIVPLR